MYACNIRVRFKYEAAKISQYVIRSAMEISPRSTPGVLVRNTLFEKCSDYKIHMDMRYTYLPIDFPSFTNISSGMKV